MNEYELYTRILSTKFMPGNQAVMAEEKLRKPQKATIDSRGVDAYSLYRYDPDDQDFLPFFNSNHEATPGGLRQFCDYIMLVSRRGKLFVLLVEMKSGGRENAQQQLQASETFMEYVRTSARRISARNGYEHFDSANIALRRVVLQPQPAALSRPTTNAKTNANRELATNPIVYRTNIFNIAYICSGQ